MKVFGKTTREEAGFSLLELMVVVLVIGLLAALAAPRFQQFQAKARTAEAVKNLHTIYGLQVAYHTATNVYASIAEPGIGADLNSARGVCRDDSNALGFDIAPCSTTAQSPVPRYAYSVRGGEAAFVAIARTGNEDANRVCPGNPSHFFALDHKQKFVAASGSLPALPPSPNANIPGKIQAIGILCPNK